MFDLFWGQWLLKTILMLTFLLFLLSHEVYKNYINEYANPEQLDEIDFDNLPGYTPIS